jgi:2',3'-cyclic-nucleotide 2'-phosphodiesterase (5'-nucleotidase family)
VAAQVEQVVGEATADIVRTPAEGSSDTPLGNFVCKVMKEYAEDVLKDYCTCGKTHKVDAAIFHSAGLRNDIKQGTLTWGDLFSVLPFNNYVVTMKLTGSQLRQVLEEGVAGRRTVQVSGVTFSYSPEAEAGKRVITKSILVNGKPLKLKKVYLVATIDALAAGYEGYFTFTKGKNVFFLERKDKARKLESSFLRDVLIRYIHTHTPVSPAETGNIKIEE